MMGSTRTGIVGHSVTRLDGSTVEDWQPVNVQIPNPEAPTAQESPNPESDGMRESSEVWEFVSGSEPAEFYWGLGPYKPVASQDVWVFLESIKRWAGSVRLGVQTFEEVPSLLYAFTGARAGMLCPPALREEIEHAVTTMVVEALQARLGDGHCGRTIIVSKDGLEVTLCAGPEPEDSFDPRPAVVGSGGRKYICSSGTIVESTAEVGDDAFEKRVKCADDLASHIEAAFLLDPVPCTDKVDYTLADTESVVRDVGILATFVAAPFSYGLSALIAGGVAVKEAMSKLKSWKKLKDGKPKLTMKQPDGSTASMELPSHDLDILDCLTKEERAAGACQLAERFRGQKDKVVVSLGHVARGSLNPIIAAVTTGAYVKVFCAMMGAERFGKRQLEIVEVRGRRGCAVQVSRCGEKCTIL